MPPRTRKPKIRQMALLGSLPMHQRTGCVDPHTGKQYTSPKLMRADQRLRKTLMLTQFAQMVAEGTLGQEPWERLPHETDAQYYRFRTYLTMQPQDGLFHPRTGERVGEGKDLGVTGPRSMRRLVNVLQCPPRGIKMQAAKYHWHLRAECYDRELHRQEDEEFAESKRAAARRQAKLGSALQDAAFKGLAALVACPGELSASDVVRMADVGVKIERLAHDKSTSNTAEQKEVRFVWDGPKPKWLDHDEAVVVAEQVEVTP